MIFIAYCVTYGGQATVRWIRDVEDFWEAVEKARYLPEKELPLPLAPEEAKGWDHLRSSEIHAWQKECTSIRIINSDRIKTVEGVRLSAIQ